MILDALCSATGIVQDAEATLNLTLALFLTAAAPMFAQSSLAERIGHTDPSKMTRSRSHGSVGDMSCMVLVKQNAIPLLNFVHRCQMMAPNGGVGHHFHNQNEEMFVIFDGEAEFTIDGH